MFACNANPGTSCHSSENGAAPLRRHPSYAQRNQVRMEQRKKLQRQELGLSDYDPLPSFQTLASEVESLCGQGHLDKAFIVLSHMDRLGFTPTYGVFWSLLSSCKRKKALHYATQLQSHLSSLILDPGNVQLANLLINTFVSCHALDMALQVFQSLPYKTSFTWTALISGYVESGCSLKALKLYKLMLKKGVKPNEYTCVSIIKACTITLNVEMGKAIDNYAQANGYKSNAFVGSALVTMYGKFNSIAEAEDVFGMMPYRSIVAWTSMLTVYVEHGQGIKALQLYRQMREECLVVDEQAFAVALQACCILATKEKGITQKKGELCKVVSLEIVEALHADVRRKGLDSNIYVGNLLVCVYGNCGNLSFAENVFAGFPQKNSALWNAMLSAYVRQSRPEKTLHLYKSMLEAGQSSEKRSFVIALQACSLLAEMEEAVFLKDSWIKEKSLKIGEALHTDATKSECDSNLYVNSAILNMYGKCGDLVKARKLFDEAPQRSIVSWNAMLSAYVEQGQVKDALQLYHQMQAQGIGQNDVTLLCLLQISGQTGSIEFCRQTYMGVVCGGFDVRPLVAFNLIYAFGKCASMVDAQAVFDALPLSNAVPWNALIAGYAQQGDYESSSHYFWRMQQVGMKPDGETFVSLLALCSYAGLVKEGLEYFDSMSTEHGITPEDEHYVIMGSLLGYAGEFGKVEDMLSKLPVQPTLSLWLHILEGCGKHGNVKLAEQAFESAVRLQPKEATAYLLMSKVCNDAGLHDLANQVAISRQEEDAHRSEEITWIEHENNLLPFSARNQENPKQQQAFDIFRALGIESNVKAEFLGFEYLKDLALEDSTQSLCGHSQLVALAFKLLNPPSRKPIRIRKNTCICQDCHQLIKLVSRVKNSSIIVIDHRRAHLFKDGKCSCHDYFYAAPTFYAARTSGAQMVLSG